MSVVCKGHAPLVETALVATVWGSISESEKALLQVFVTRAEQRLLDLSLAREATYGPM